MNEHWIDRKDREVGRCGYCLRVGHAKNLRRLPEKYDTVPYLEYCPTCYPDVFREVRNQPWNKDI